MGLDDREDATGWTYRVPISSSVKIIFFQKENTAPQAEYC